MKTAAFYREEKEKSVQCLLCPQHCLIKNGNTGLCQARKNIDGKLYSLNYGRITSAHMDPIEKKPLYHFYPGSRILSLGTLGCNLSCSFCQNSSISQIPSLNVESFFNINTSNITVGEVVALVRKFDSDGNIGIAYTYNEPSIWYEFVLDAAREVKKAGYKNVLVTNGFLETAPALELLPYIDAVNVDIKSINDGYYKKLCGGRVKPVLEYCRTAKELNLSIEITNLIVTGENDSKEDLCGLVDWVSENLGRDTPLHFSRYHPDFRFSAPATPAVTLARAYEIAIKKLDYVYVGNILDDNWNSTRCPSCHKIVIERSGFGINGINLKGEGFCSFCGAKVNIQGEFSR